MSFTIESTISQLERTPHVLYQLLYNADVCWTHAHEGAHTWSPFDVLGHLIHCEQTNWIPRIQLILSDTEHRTFTPFDRQGSTLAYKVQSTNELLENFVLARTNSLNQLRSLHLTEEQLARTAIHPDFGEVTLRQLLATWLVHDWDHLAQIARVMAFQYRDEVGPWKDYLRVVRGND